MAASSRPPWNQPGGSTGQDFEVLSTSQHVAMSESDIETPDAEQEEYSLRSDPSTFAYPARDTGQDMDMMEVTYGGGAPLAIMRSSSGDLRTPAEWYCQATNAADRRRALYSLFFTQADAVQFLEMTTCRNKEKLIAFVQSHQHIAAYVLVDRAKDKANLVQSLHEIGLRNVAHAVCGRLDDIQPELQPEDWPQLRFAEDFRISRLPLEDKLKIANKLSNIRIGREKTYEALADLLDVDTDTYHQYESVAAHRHEPLAMPLFNEWEIKPFATVGNLYWLLQVIDRSDIAEVLHLTRPNNTS